MSHRGRILTFAAASAMLLATAPAALATRASITGKINPDKGPVGTPLALTIGFTLDPDAGQEGDTLTKAVLNFPPNGVHNGKLFPSCSAKQIMAKRGRFTDCPRGSLIGRGTLRADVPAVPVYNVPGRVTLFNGPRGRSLTVHIYATNPVLISEAFDAPIVRTRGRYGYRLTSVVPEILQEINGPGGGWFAVLRKFNATTNAKIKDRKTGRTRGFIEAKRCPKSRRVPIAGTFEFLRGAGTSTVGYISCRPS